MAADGWPETLPYNVDLARTVNLISIYIYNLVLKICLLRNAIVFFYYSQATDTNPWYQYTFSTISSLIPHSQSVLLYSLLL